MGFAATALRDASEKSKESESYDNIPKISRKQRPGVVSHNPFTVPRPSGRGKFLGLEEQVQEEVKEGNPENEDCHNEMFIEGVIFMLRTHTTTRDSLVFEYTTVWSRVKYLFNSLSQTDISNKPVSFF